MVQPTPKQMTRGQKEAKVEEFVQKIESHPVIGILDMHSLPSKQLQQMKKEMKEFADIKMSRKTLMDLAIQKAEKENIEELKENDATQPAFIFSDKDPFQLYSLIQNNKTSAAAQGGEEAPNDIEVPEGDTGIGPGPMLGKLQGAGLNVQVEDGSIHVQEPGVIVEKGETIDNDTAEILNQVGIEPLEIGLDLVVAYSEGEIFAAEELDIDTEEYRRDVEAASSAAFNLAVNAGYITGRTAPTTLANAVRKAKNLAISEGIPTEETVEDSISVASGRARSLDSQLEVEEPEEDEEPADDGEDDQTDKTEDPQEADEEQSEEADDSKEEESEEETQEAGEKEE